MRIKARQLTSNSAFQLRLVAFWHWHWLPSSTSEALLAAAECPIRWDARTEFARL
jgi:hypothetical protein